VNISSSTYDQISAALKGSVMYAVLK